MSDSAKWFWLTLALLLAVLIYLLTPVLTPFVIGAILAYIGDPLADRLEAKGFSRTSSVVIVFITLTLLALLLLLILIPMLEKQVDLLAQKLPHYLDWLQSKGLPAAGALLGLEPGQFDLEAFRDYVRQSWQGIGSGASRVVTAISSSGATVAGWLANLLLVPVVAFYLLRDWDRLMENIRALVPRPIEPQVVQLARASDEVLGAFLRGQLTVMAALSGVYSVGLWLAGIELALLIGLLAGVVSFVPYLGFIVGIAAAAVAALMQYHDVVHLAYVAAVFTVGQLLEGMVLTPMLVGDRIGLHPVAVIFAVLAGGQLFGFFGVLVALPVAAVVMVLLRYAHRQYRQSELYGNDSIGAPEE